MNTLSDEQLAQRKAKTLETFKAFIAFCQANNLKYYAAYGTVLGAARHHGFIPWDDDIDVYLRRDDYDRCLRLLRADPPVGYEVVDYLHEEEYYLPFAKFCDTRSTVCEWEDYRISFGNYIDLFPLDAVPDDNAARERHCEHLLKLRGTLAADLKRQSWAAIAHKAATQSLRLTVADVAYALARTPIRNWLVKHLEKPCVPISMLPQPIYASARATIHARKTSLPTSSATAPCCPSRTSALWYPPAMKTIWLPPTVTGASCRLPTNAYSTMWCSWI